MHFGISLDIRTLALRTTGTASACKTLAVIAQDRTKLKSIFTIAESNDKRFKFTYWTSTLVSISLFYLAYYLKDVVKLVSSSFAQTIAIFGLVIWVSTFAIRLLFKNHKAIGQVTITEKQFSILTAGKVKTYLNLKKIEFHFGGSFGAYSTNRNALFKDGTGNKLTLISETDEKESFNIYLENSEEKEDLVIALGKFCSKNKIDIDLGSLVSI